jgi:hypothetical protein
LSQALFGEVVRVRRISPDRKWLAVESGDDRDAGWMRAWSIALGPAAAVQRWRTAAAHMVDRPWVALAGLALPFGARVARVGGRTIGPLGALPLPARALARVPQRARSGAPVLAAARRFAGTAYHWGGRTPAGLDCSGLVQLAAARNGIVLPRDAREQCAVFGGTAALRRLETPGIRPGDLWFFGPNRRTVTHVAVSAGGLELVHAYGWVRAGSLDPAAAAFEPELFRAILGWAPLGFHTRAKR